MKFSNLLIENEMFQNILVLIIIAFIIVYSVYAVVKNIRKKDASPCDDCNGCDIKREISKNMKNKSLKNPTTCGNNSKK